MAIDTSLPCDFAQWGGQNLSISESSKVGDLRILIQKSLGKGFVTLITPQGHNLTDPLESLQSERLQEVRELAVVVREVKVAATAKAFALRCSGGDQILTSLG